MVAALSEAEGRVHTAETRGGHLLRAVRLRAWFKSLKLDGVLRSQLSVRRRRRAVSDETGQDALARDR